MQPIDLAAISQLNEDCFCLPLERSALEAAAAARLGAAEAPSAAGELEALSAGQPMFLPVSMREDLYARIRAVGAALVLDTVPHTEPVDCGNAGRLWEARRDYVFKPAQGYASRGVYRGDKITRKKWCEIVGEGYLAQRFAEPSQRFLQLAGGLAAHKADIRVWTHGFEPVFAAARLYGGQVTGFRGEGAGFAPILWLGAPSARAGCVEAGCADEPCACATTGATS